MGTLFTPEEKYAREVKRLVRDAAEEHHLTRLPSFRVRFIEEQPWNDCVTFIIDIDKLGRIRVTLTEEYIRDAMGD